MATNDWKIFAAENLKIESIFVPKVKAALKKQYSSFIDDLQTFGVEYTKNQLTFFTWDENILSTIRHIYEKAGLRGAVSSYSYLKRELKYSDFGMNDEWTRSVLEYLQTYLLNKAVIPVSETTKKFILSVIEAGLNEGWGIDKMVAKIKDESILEARARMITRTEVIRAANVGHTIGAKSFPYEVTKGWIAARDHRTRHSHRLVNGEVVEEEDAFSNGLLFPGDPNGSAKEVINCRCRVIYKAKRDKSGRIIPRSTQPLMQDFRSSLTKIFTKAMNEK